MTDRATAPNAVALGGRLSIVVAALWVVLAGPAYLMAGALGLEGLSYAAAINLLPGWLVFLILSRYRTPNVAATAVLAGTFLRLVSVLLGVALVRAARPHLGLREFIVWILVFYLVTLAVETSLIVRSRAE
jgi:hypothetical protein